MLKTQDEIEAIVKHVFQTLNCSHLVCRTWFNRRLTRCAGMARRKFGLNSIELSPELLARCSDDEQRNTIIHEACHICCYHLYPGAKGHGREWKSLMVRFGEKPERCHTIDRTGLKRTVKRYLITCVCSTTHKVSSSLITKIKNGQKRCCPKCKTVIVLPNQLQYITLNG